jgi:acylglycerol lipase
MSVLWNIVEPGLQKFHLYNPPDPTYGRYLIKPWAPEETLDLDSTIVTRRRRVFLHARADADSVDIEFAEDVQLLPEELDKERLRTGRWVYYKTWEMKEESLSSKEGLGVDILLVHGTPWRVTFGDHLGLIIRLCNLPTPKGLNEYGCGVESYTA